jgi:pectate lyase
MTVNPRSFVLVSTLTLAAVTLNGYAADADGHSRSDVRTQAATALPDAAVYIQRVRRFADVVLAHGRDSYGRQKTPLFVDGLHAGRLEPVIWKGKGRVKGEVEDWVLCNFASQQALLRTLDGLSGLTGESKYRQAAEDAARYALEHLVSPSGLLYWGGHLAWDLQAHEPVGQGGPNTHELKGNQPHYRLMWRVHPSATRKLMEAVWAGHVLDWSLLDYNRHARVQASTPPQWDSAFNSAVQIPFPAVGRNLSFVNVVPPLMHAGVMLAVLGDNHTVLTWTRRLVHRWQEGRDTATGLCGGQLSYLPQDRAQAALGHVHPEINEAKIVATYHQTGRYHQLPLAQMQAGEDLIAAGGDRAKVGGEFIAWASDDLKVYARRCYDPEKGVFVARMTDGTAIQGEKSKAGYYVAESFAPRPADGLILWTYATAYRVTRDVEHWRMAGELMRLLGLGELGRPEGPRKLAVGTDHADWRTLYGLLELYRATQDRQILELACRVGDNLLRMQADSGLFPRPGYDYARTGDEAPLAILHLAAAIAGRSARMPAPRYDHAFFHCVYAGELEEHQRKRDDSRTYDHMVFYGRH